MTYPPLASTEGDGESASGDVFEGYMCSGVKDGTGKYTWSSGIVYEGNYKNNLRHGQGVLELINGARFEGRFELYFKKWIYLFTK